MKPGLTVLLELTPQQVRGIRALGRILWPGINLGFEELCRRILLGGADGMITGEWKEGVMGPRLLEPESLPTGGSIAEDDLPPPAEDV